MPNEIKTRFDELVNESYTLLSKVTDMKTSVLNSETLLGMKQEVAGASGEERPQETNREALPVQGITIRSNQETAPVMRTPSLMIKVPATAQVNTTKPKEAEGMTVGDFKYKKQAEDLKIAAQVPQKLKENVTEELAKVEQNIPVPSFKGEAASENKKISAESMEGTTPIHSLLGLVIRNKKLSIDEAAKMLNTSPMLIESWARILDSDGLIKLQFPIIGKPVMVSI